MTVMDPHEARVAARFATYGNRIEEDQNIARVDQEVWARVKVHEEGVVNATRAHMAKYERLLKEADEVETEIRETIRYAASDGRAVDSQFATEFERLRLRAQAIANSLEIAEKAAAFHVERCRDVYGSYVTLVKKWPGLAPAIRVQ